MEDLSPHEWHDKRLEQMTKYAPHMLARLIRRSERDLAQATEKGRSNLIRQIREEACYQTIQRWGHDLVSAHLEMEDDGDEWAYSLAVEPLAQSLLSSLPTDTDALLKGVPYMMVISISEYAADIVDFVPTLPFNNGCI